MRYLFGIGVVLAVLSGCRSSCIHEAPPPRYVVVDAPPPTVVYRPGAGAVAHVYELPPPPARVEVEFFYYNGRCYRHGARGYELYYGPAPRRFYSWEGNCWHHHR